MEGQFWKNEKLLVAPSNTLSTNVKGKRVGFVTCVAKQAMRATIKLRPALAMVVVEAVVSMDTTTVAVDMVVGGAANVDADDRQSKRSRGDDENGGSKKDHDRDGERP